jgi:hypothetical protein
MHLSLRREGGKWGTCAVEKTQCHRGYLLNMHSTKMLIHKVRSNQHIIFFCIFYLGSFLCCYILLQVGTTYLQILLTTEFSEAAKTFLRYMNCLFHLLYLATFVLKYMAFKTNKLVQK